MIKAKQETKNHKAKPSTKHLIGTLSEKSLHSPLKDWYAQSGDHVEAEVDGFHIDIIRNDLLIEIGRRKSPKKGNLFHLFEELVSIPDLIRHPNFSLEVLLIQEEEVRCDDGTGSWRRKGLRIVDHRLIEVLDQHIFKEPFHLLALIPPDLTDPFSTKELAEGIDQPRWIAQKMAYCLRNMGIIEIVGKNGNSLLYSASKTVIG